MANRDDLRVIGQDQRVPTADGRFLPYANLDNAASTPALVYVAKKVEQFLPWYASVHRGAGLKSRLTTEIFEEARLTVADFFGYDPGTNVVLFGKNTTEALNKLAYRWPWRPGDIVMSSLVEHHSNDLPWRSKAKRIYLGLRPDGAIDLDHLEWYLSLYSPYVKLVALTGASNVTGCLTDIHCAAAIAHRYGAKIAIDGAQLAAHRLFQAGPDDDPVHIDFLAISGHKIYAPFGQGALIGPRAFFNSGAPEFAGGGTVTGVTLNSVRWAPPPEREEAGTPNVVGAVALAAALKHLAAYGLSVVETRERDLTSYLFSGLRSIDDLVIYGPSFPAVDRVGVVSFNLGDLPHGLVAAVLACEDAIGVRDGCFCARPYVRKLLGVDAREELLESDPDANEESQLPGMVRASLGLYNRTEEIARLVKALRRIAENKNYYRLSYAYDPRDGYWWPRGWRPRFEQWFRLGD